MAFRFSHRLSNFLCKKTSFAVLLSSSWIITYGIIYNLFTGCQAKHQPQNNDLETFVDQGRLWAYGRVELGPASQSVTFLLKPVAGDQIFDSSLMPIKSVDLRIVGKNGLDEKDVAYVDNHPTDDKLLAYIYTIELQDGGQDRGLVYGILRQPGRSLNRLSVYLGSVPKKLGSDPIQLTLAPNLKSSLIVDGPLQGYWALHYPEVQKIVLKPWSGLCPRPGTVDRSGTTIPNVIQGTAQQGTAQQGVVQVGQQPGQSVAQNPNQNPGQFDLCRAIQPEVDLCGGEPGKKDCFPNLRPLEKNLSVSKSFDEIISYDGTTQDGAIKSQSTEPSSKWSISFKNLQAFEQNSQVLMQDKILDSSSAANGEIYFTHADKLVASEAENTNICTTKFIAVAQTLAGIRNEVCQLTLLPSQPMNGHLNCGLQVSFDNPQTYLEKICHIIVQLRAINASDINGQFQHLQVIRR